MNLKKLIYRTRSRGIPVYCCFLILVSLLFKHFYLNPLWADSLSQDLQKYLRYNAQYKLPTRSLHSDEISNLTSIIDVINYERPVHMKERFGKMTSNTDIIVVQVHRDVERLQYLIVSLAQVPDLQSVLLVFSHSYYDDKINKLVASIDFCRYMQIFYPYSLQLYPNTFPGIDPEDCMSVPKDMISPLQCSDRDGTLTEHKHHWWWKANFIFNNLDWSHNYKGTVIFLEEDNYVLPDLLHMLRYTKRSLDYLHGVQVMSLGRSYANGLEYDLLSVLPWRPLYDIGLAFNKTVWEKISAVSAHFCMYNDISWSYSLLNAFGKFREGRADVVAATAPRVLSTKMFQNGHVAAQQIRVWLNEGKMFPLKVKAMMLYNIHGRVDMGVKAPPRGNGGWSDLRDHLLCLDPLLSTTTNNINHMTITNSLPTSSSVEYSTIAYHRINISAVDISSML